MKTHGICLSIFWLLLSGCDSDSSSNNESSPLLGTWVTEACEQASDSNGALINLWLKGLYEFTAQGTILLGNETYSDSNCITLSSTIPLNNGAIPAIYQDLGPTLLQEGIDGGGLSIEISAGAQLLSIDAFYTINNSALCFSDVFTFEALTFALSEAGTAAIDFNNCLTRP